MNLREKIRDSNNFIKVSIGVIIISMVGIIDYYTTSEISFSIFYLVPISFVTWYVGRPFGIGFAALAAIIWFYMDKLGIHMYSNDAVPYWNALVRFGFFMTTVLLIAKVKALKDNLEISVVQRTSDLVSEIELHKKTKEEMIVVNEQLRELNKKIETIKEEQNTRIAREIHDEMGQSLTGINLELMWISKKYSGNIDLVERMQMLSGIVGDTISMVRKISSDLRPRLLDQLGIFPAIDSQLKEFSKRTGTQYRFKYPEGKTKIDNVTSTTIYRIFMETLTNIARHSKCSIVDVNFEIDKENILVMSIKDNGIGFNFDKEYQNTEHHGIIGIKERANILNGAVEFITSPGKGSEIILRTVL